MIEQILRDKIGLDPKSVGCVKLADDIARRMRQTGCATERQYFEYLHGYPQELDELIDLVTVPETWFFRHPKAFAYLGTYLAQRAAAPGPALRILSSPCSTGEEPYSIAMLLAELGISAAKASIDAIDINARVLATARHGRYGQNSFRSKDLEFRDQHFQPEAKLYALKPEIRTYVSFQQYSILDNQFWNCQRPYNVIFCRNLLIYMPADKQQQVLALLLSHLTEDGLLFLGHAESGLTQDSGFESVNVAETFAYRKRSNQAAARPALAAASLHHQRPGQSAGRHTVAAARPVALAQAGRSSDLVDRVPSRSQVASEPTLPSASLAAATKAADQGDMRQAEALCSEYIATHKTDPDGHCLMGTILLANKHGSAAATCFQRALYLEPKHAQALAQLVLLKESAGDLDAADRLRRRLRELPPPLEVQS